MGALIKIEKDDYLIILDTRTVNEKRMKPVIQYDLNGNEIARYPSIAEAQRITKILHIYECVNNKRKTAGGFIWKLSKGESYEK